MPLHPDDDRAEAGPRVEPGVDARQLGRAVWMAHHFLAQSGRSISSRRRDPPRDLRPGLARGRRSRRRSARRSQIPMGALGAPGSLHPAGAPDLLPLAKRVRQRRLRHRSPRTSTIERMRRWTRSHGCCQADRSLDHLIRA